MLSDIRTSSRDALADFSISQLLGGTKLVEQSAFFQLSLLLEARKGAFQREDWEGGMPRRHTTTAQCQPGVPLLLGNPERF